MLKAVISSNRKPKMFRIVIIRALYIIGIIRTFQKPLKNGGFVLSYNSYYAQCGALRCHLCAPANRWYHWLNSKRNKSILCIHFNPSVLKCALKCVLRHVSVSPTVGQILFK